MQNFQDNILLYLENGLSPTENAAFEAALQKDADLQTSVAQTRKMMALMKQAAKKEKAKAEITRIIEAKKNPAPIIVIEPQKRNFRSISAIAASIFLILGLSFWVSQSTQNPYIQQHFRDYVVDRQMGDDITPFITLSNTYIKNDDSKFREVLQKVQPKDTAEFYALYSMKGTMEKRRKLYSDALFSFLTAENYAKKEDEKIQTAVNQIALLLATKQHDKAKERKQRLFLEIPAAEKKVKIDIP